MSDLIRRDSEAIVGVPCTLANGDAFVLPAVALVNSSGEAVSSISSIGSPTDAAWNGTDPSATVISLLKAIALNTEPA